jgi:hypothetical protein
MHPLPFALTANGGYTAYSFAQLFLPGTGWYTLAGNVTQPIFEGFTLLNKQKAAEAGLTQAEAQYRQSVITCRRESPMIYGSARVSTSYRFQRIHIFLDLSGICP